MRLTFVTGNRHKFEEASELASRYGVKLGQRDMPYIEIQADELESVVRPGVQQACALLGGPCLIEDSGLFIRVLRGFPGVYSKHVFLTIGCEGVLKLMRDVVDRTSEFRSVVGYCEPGQKPVVFSGKAEGTITHEPRGSGGFGFDPIFSPREGDGRTFAQMSTAEKNKYSHRAKAFQAFFSWFKEKKDLG